MALVEKLYRQKLASGNMQANEDQAQAVKMLDKLAVICLNKKPRVLALWTGLWTGLCVWWLRLFSGQDEAGRGTARGMGRNIARNIAQDMGLYIHGPVGRGKTMVMDLFVEALAHTKVRIKRTHFHRFFSTVHENIHQRRATGLKTEDVMVVLAKEMAGQYDVLAFDEFYVNNIADAMIIGRFLDALFRAGIIVICTSNEAPNDLYSGGLQRERFVPTIQLISTCCSIVSIDTGIDYRLMHRRLPSTFFTPLGSAAGRFLDATLSDLTGDMLPTELTLYLSGSRLRVPSAVGGFARFSYDQLCEQPLGRTEYFALAEGFIGLFLSDVPCFDADNRASSERFRVLIDILYNKGRFLAMTAAAPLEQLVQTDEDEQRLNRTLSRLIEMQSPHYVHSALG